MHYSGNKEECIKLLHTKEPYMTLKPSNRIIPINKQLSKLDIIALKQIYAPPSKLCLNHYISYDVTSFLVHIENNFTNIIFSNSTGIYDVSKG